MGFLYSFYLSFTIGIRTFYVLVLRRLSYFKDRDDINVILKPFLSTGDLPYFEVNLSDIIQGDKFEALASSNVFFVETHKVNDFFLRHKDSEKFILISHQSDAVVTNDPRQINRVRSDEHADISLLLDNCHMWFAQNVEVRHTRLVPIPIGFHNDKYNKHNISIINGLRNSPRVIKNVVYLNVNVNNNLREREYLYKLFEGVSYVTKLRGQFGIDFEGYARDVSSHLFMLCPEGNGIDVHQPYEAIALGCIPIIKRRINNEELRDLPVCWVDSFEEILNVNFLLDEYVKIRNGVYNLDKFHFTYWHKVIHAAEKSMLEI